MARAGSGPQAGRRPGVNPVRARAVCSDIGGTHGRAAQLTETTWQRRSDREAFDPYPRLRSARLGAPPRSHWRSRCALGAGSAVGRPLGSIDDRDARRRPRAAGLREGRPPLGRRHARPGIRIRVCNTTGGRVLAVMSVDGVNVCPGETASPAQSGYVLSAYECADIDGWRKSLARTAAFYFTELPDAYAARTGRPDNVGVIGVAFFRERPQPVAPKARRPARSPRAARPSRRRARTARGQAQCGRCPREPRKRRARARPRRAAAPAPLAKLGTGHGRSEHVVRADHALRARERDAERRRSPSITIAARTSSRWASCPRPTIARVPTPFPGGATVRAGSADSLTSRRPSIAARPRGPLAYSRAMSAPAIAHPDGDSRGDEDADARVRRGRCRGVRCALRAPQGRRVPLPHPPVRQRRQRRTNCSRTCG